MNITWEVEGIGLYILDALYQLKTFRQSILNSGFTGQITRAWRKRQSSKKSKNGI